MGFWDDLEVVLAEATTTQIASSLAEGAEQADSRPSLFRSVRAAIGVEQQDMDCADVSFWEWREMRALLLRAWGALDAVATRRSGRREQALVWVRQPEQSGLDLSEFVREARSGEPSLGSLRVHRRPEALLMVNIGKIDAAICSTIAVVVSSSECPYGEILHKMLQMGGTDEELLTFLDSEVDRNGADRGSCHASAIPRELVRAKQNVRDQMGFSFASSFVEFLETLDSANNLTNVTDEALLMRLLRIAPEENQAISRKVARLSLSSR